MTHVLHLVRWDARRFQILLPLWLLLVVATAVLEGIWPGIAVAMEARQTMGVTGNLLAFAEVLVSIVFIVLVVQEHPVIGTTAFWMTRPIPAHTLLAAKVILLCATVVIAPAITEVVLMTAYDVPARQNALVAVQTAMYWTFWLSVVMVFAALTRNMAKFALAIGAVIASTIVAAIAIGAIMFDRMGDIPPIPMARAPYNPTSGVMDTLLFIAVLTIVLTTFYRTRARGRAILLGAAGFALAVYVSNALPWSWLAPKIETPAWAMESSALQLSISQDDVQLREASQHFGNAPSQWTIGRAPTRLSGLAPGWSAGAGLRQASLRVLGRELLITDVGINGPNVAVDDTERMRQNEVIRSVLKVDRLIDFESRQQPQTAVVLVARTSELRQLSGDRGDYEGRFSVSLTRHDVQAVLPFRSGAAVQVAAYRFALDRMTRHGYRISAVGRESVAGSVLDRQPRSRTHYYLRNPQTSEAIEGSRRELRTDVTLTRFIPFAVSVDNGENMGFRAVAVELNFPTSYGEQNAVVFDDTWFERSELVIVRSTEAGSVERTLAIAGFPIRMD